MPNNNEMEFIETPGCMLRFTGDRGPKPGIKIFRSNFLYITFISSVSATIEIRPQFIDSQKANSLKYVTTMDNKRYDQTVSGVDEPKLPPQKTMIANFLSSNQNYTEIKEMIEETKKRDNRDFGQQIIKEAQKIRERRELKNVRKDFVGEHTKTVKYWPAI